MNFVIYLFAVLKNVIYGSTIFFTSTLNKTTDVLDILALRFLLSFLVFTLFIKLKGIKLNFSFKRIKKEKDYRHIFASLFLAALFEPVLYMFFETLGVSLTTNITASTILALSPIVTCFAEAFILKEKASLIKILFLFVGIVGVVYIALNTKSSNGKDSVIGILIIFLAATTGPLYAVFSRKSSQAFTAIEITYFSAFLGAVVFNAINIVRHIANGTISGYFKPFMNVENVIGFLFLSVVSTIVATGMNNFALSKMPASTMAAFGGLSMIVTITLGVLFNNEKIYYYHIIGITLILVRIFAVSFITMKEEKK